MKKSTHEGTCQVCGKLQALPGGKLSKHGYDVELHYFRGVCPGAGHLPLEQDRTVADEVAVDLAIQSRIHAKDAEAVKDGTLLPVRVATGKWEWNEVTRKRHYLTVPYAEGTEAMQVSAVNELYHRLLSQSRMEQSASEQITSRANAITGKVALRERAPEVAKKVIVAGTRVKLWGEEVTVLRVENRTARGCGPYLNGQVVPHLVYARDDGREFGYPVQRVRQASIIG